MDGGNRQWDFSVQLFTIGRAGKKKKGPSLTSRLLLQLHSPLQLQVAVNNRHGKLVGRYVQSQHPALTKRIKDHAALVEQLTGCGALINSQGIIRLHL